MDASAVILNVMVGKSDEAIEKLEKMKALLFEIDELKMSVFGERRRNDAKRLALEAQESEDRAMPSSTY